MADTKTLEREYTIPLRRVWLRSSQYDRTRKAVIAIKQFIARHMKVEDRDQDKVKLDVYLNNEVWFRGRANPPSKIKVKAIKEGDIVKVTFVETPKHVAFLKAKHAKRHQPSQKKEEKKEEKVEKKTEEEKTNEKEKEQSVAEQHSKEFKQDAKAEKHLTKSEKVIHPQRMALKK